MVQSEITQVVEKYFQGFSKAESGLVAEVFHPVTQLYSTENGALESLGMAPWIEGLDRRRCAGDLREGSYEILSLDAEEDAAAVKLRVVFPKREFTDYLSLLKIEGQWRIVGKIYTSRERS